MQELNIVDNVAARYLINIMIGHLTIAVSTGSSSTQRHVCQTNSVLPAHTVNCFLG